MAFEGRGGLGNLARGKGAIINGSAVCGGRKGAVCLCVCVFVCLSLFFGQNKKERKKMKNFLK